MSSQEEAARAERLAAALRANLARRKQQARGRKEPPDAQETTRTAPDSPDGGATSPDLSPLAEAPARPDGEG
ncbi:hypothetical protein [Ancylobacter sp. FA202]|uniref:hypothetical protein n=1 Tax=Ancylobacter sp. FA202 TaxID=1111106 RepID=UPI000360DDD9|nr:hypothetical protein [Ancylobacter sp. FA202]